MEIKITQKEKRATVSIIGTIDTETAPKLQKALQSLDYSDLDLTLDLAQTDYITSAGLRTLLIARKKLSDNTMRLINVNESIIEVFKVTGFDTLLNYTPPSAPADAVKGKNFKSLLCEKSHGASRSISVFVQNDRYYTWEDVDKASQIIADDLYAAGVRKGTHVALCAPNSINWIFTFFAIQKLGGIAVLVNFGLQPAEIIALAEIADITHLCYGAPAGTDFGSFTASLSDAIPHLYDIGQKKDFTLRFCEYDAVQDLYDESFHEDDASVIIFTSGSTGTPKAVLCSSRNLLHCIPPIIREFRITAKDRNCAFLPMFHVFGFATCICLGLLTDCLSAFPDKSDPATLIDVIDRYQCTMFHSVPTAVLAMTQHPAFSSSRVSSLRCSALGGSATSEEQMHYLRRLFPHNHFANLYGMSENAAISITRYEDTVEHITQTVGVPVPGVSVEIRDISTDAVLPAGEIGEICIRSENMIVCYYKLAIDKQPLDDTGWLKTGDLGFLDRDGYLHISGRIKELIIRGGENISPNEVAAALSELPSIADAKVFGVPHDLYGEEVAAAVVLRDGCMFDEEDIRNRLSTRLARFKIPVHFLVVDCFPLLGTGKIDVAALKKEVMDR